MATAKRRRKQQRDATFAAKNCLRDIGSGVRMR
jgi:hypothetical protein